MSPSIKPVVCRATSGAQSPSSGGLIVLHHASKPPKAMAKTASTIRLRLRRMKSATIVASPRTANTIAAAPLKTSGVGNRDQSASALHAVSGATSKIATRILRASPAALFIMTNLASFPAASLQLGERLEEAETCAKPWHSLGRSFERGQAI